MGMLRVAMVDADVQYCRELCALLEEANVFVAPLYSLEDLPAHLRKEQVGVLMVDLDNLPVNNKFFRSLKEQYPSLHILCLSSRTFHPGLEETMGSHICASLTKPLNSEELFYWLKAISENEPEDGT